MTQKQPRPKKILHVMPSLDVGGVEKGMMDIYAHLAPQGYQCDVIVEQESVGDLGQKWRSLGGGVHAIGRFKSWRFCVRFMRCVKQNGPYDAVHSHCYFFSGLVMALAFFARVPRRIAHLHSAHRARKASLFSLCYYSVLRRLISVFATRILAVSTAAAQDFAGEGWAQNKKIAIQPLGIDFDAFKAAQGTDERLLGDLAIAHDAKCLVHIGRFTQEKNHRFIITLFENLYAAGTVSHLILIGEGRLKTELERDPRISKLVKAGAIIFTGLRHDCPALLSALHGRGLFVFPSLYEGFGLAAVEAQCAGLPVLASTHVPADVAIIPHYFKQLALSAPLSEWTMAAQTLLAQTPLTAAQCTAYMQESGLSVQKAAAALRGYYEAA
jgi:glycosyltransferase involved in cell wall biosynthesis